MLDNVRAAYLDLLKGCLTRSAFGEAYKPLVKPEKPQLKNRLWWNLAYPMARPALSAIGVEMVRRANFDPEACRTGAYYHSEAGTMIGLTGLDNIQRCVVDCLERGVPGDLLEAGTWRGGTAIFMRAILQAYGDRTRTVWLADSFAGCPRPQNEKDLGDRHSENKFLIATLEDVRNNFARYDLLDDRVRFLAGWFRDTLNSPQIPPLAVLRLDADMYSSTMEALTALYPKVSPGGYVIIDDYFTIDSCRQAVDDYRSQMRINDKIEAVDQCRACWRVSAKATAASPPLMHA